MDSQQQPRRSVTSPKTNRKQLISPQNSFKKADKHAQVLANKTNASIPSQLETEHLVTTADKRKSTSSSVNDGYKATHLALFESNPNGLIFNKKVHFEAN
jgi:hypothetical protein